MAFQQFQFPSVVKELGLTLTESDLYSAIEPIAVRSEFVAEILDGSNLASAINTEKARSEFAIAPVLLELRRMHPERLSLFSGVELDADSSRGLSGVCDFLLSRSPNQHVLTAPIFAIVEAKNDNLRTGFGQCIASMMAAQIVNGATPTTSFIHGAVSTGSLWKFLRLTGTSLALDRVEYHIDNLGKLMGILSKIVEA